MQIINIFGIFGDQIRIEPLRCLVFFLEHIFDDRIMIVVLALLCHDELVVSALLKVFNNFVFEGFHLRQNLEHVLGKNVLLKNLGNCWMLIKYLNPSLLVDKMTLDVSKCLVHDSSLLVEGNIV